MIVKNVDSFPRGNLRELVQTPELMKIGFDLHPAGARGDKLLGSLMFNSESTNFACRIVELRLSCVGLMICSPAHGGVGIRFMAKGLLDLPG